MKKSFILSILFTLLIFTQDMLAVSKIYTVNLVYNYGETIPRELLCFKNKTKNIQQYLTRNLQDTVIMEFTKTLSMRYENFQLKSNIDRNNSCDMMRNHSIDHEDTFSFSIGDSNTIYPNEVEKVMHDSLNIAKKYSTLDPKISIHLAEKF